MSQRTVVRARDELPRTITHDVSTHGSARQRRTPPGLTPDSEASSQTQRYLTLRNDNPNLQQYPVTVASWHVTTFICSPYIEQQ